MDRIPNDIATIVYKMLFIDNFNRCLEEMNKEHSDVYTYHYNYRDLSNGRGSFHGFQCIYRIDTDGTWESVGTVPKRYSYSSGMNRTTGFQLY